MVTKLFILFVMLVIAGSLFSGLFFLVSDNSSKRTVKALTIRISISVILFIFLLIAFKFGWIKPHGI